jgi:NhaP-type Na+/H+ or K+/H+ antiporter
MMSRSNSANAPKIWKISFPPLVVVSIIVHGLSVTPLMHRYSTWQERDRADASRQMEGGRSN